jgi:hypothetical protein
MLQARPATSVNTCPLSAKHTEKSAPLSHNPNEIMSQYMENEDGRNAMIRISLRKNTARESTSGGNPHSRAEDQEQRCVEAHIVAKASPNT